MKKLNTIFSFVLLSFCLLINVSTAVTIEANTTLPFDSSNSCLTTTTLPSHSFCGFSYDYIAKAVWNAYANNSEVALNEVISTCASQGFSRYLITLESRMTTKTRYEIWFFPDNEEIDFGCYIRDGVISITPYFPQNSSCYQFFYVPESDSANYGYRTFNRDVVWSTGNTSYLSEDKILKINGIDIKLIDTDTALWDGTSYYYQAPVTEEPETSTMPTNAEIASAVQMFNDNKFDEEKTGKKIGYSDFLVLYDKTTKKYSYICHGMGTSLGQVIVEPNGYYEGYKYDVQWWKFFKDTNSNDYNIIRDYTNYAVYTSYGTLESLTYVGSSNISGLVDKSGPWATSNTIIVYSTKDYPVKYITFSEDGTETYVQNGTIQGDQYTYDENLDITDNNYNPLDNFVTVDPVDTVIGNVNFSEINKTFEENKGILNIENASWLFTANNKLIGYFIGFLSLLIVFLIISRALGG